MLTRTRFLTLTLCALAVPTSACFITVTDDGSTGGTGGGGSTTQATSTTDTTTTTTDATSTSTDASSTSTGMTVCNDPGAAGSGAVEDACDAMANFPKQCPDNSTPVAIDACHIGFTVFAPRGWEQFQACLGEIPATIDDTCDLYAETNVKACVQKMYDSACANPAADQLCTDAYDACVVGGENDFDTAQCQADLVPFGLNPAGQASGLQQYHDCINANLQTPCAVLHDTCMNFVLGGGG